MFYKATKGDQSIGLKRQVVLYRVLVNIIFTTEGSSNSGLIRQVVTGGLWNRFDCICLLMLY